jgi:hypothetical protein
LNTDVNTKNFASIVLSFNRPAKQTAANRSYNSVKIKVKVKVKVSLYRPLQLQGIEVIRISRQSAYEGGNDISPTNRLPLPSTRYL